MDYRLKDAALQKKLDEISGRDFSRSIKRLFASGFPISDPIYLAFGDMQPYGFADGFGNLRRFSICICKDEIEEDLTHDPYGWNDYPYIRPPEGVLMLVECIDEDDKTFKTCAEYVEDGHGAYYWRNEYEIDVPVKRFRPLE